MSIHDRPFSRNDPRLSEEPKPSHRHEDDPKKTLASYRAVFKTLRAGLDSSEDADLDSDVIWSWREKFWVQVFRLADREAVSLPRSEVDTFLLNEFGRIRSGHATGDKLSKKVLAFAKSIPRELFERFLLAESRKMDRYRRLDYDKADLVIRVSTLQEKKRLSPCKDEEWTVRWIEEYLQPGDVFYVVGANVGAYSLIACSVMKGHGRVIAFEPSASTYAALCSNVVENGFQEVVTCVPAALWARTGLEVFNYRDMDSGVALHSLGQRRTGKHEEQPAARLNIMVFRIEDLVKMFDLPWPHHIKLDVDGGEEHVLEGAREALSRPELKTVMIEISQTDESGEQRVGNLFRQCGMERLHRYEKQSVDGSESLSYTLFARPSIG